MTKRTKTHKFSVDLRYVSLSEAIKTLQTAQKTAKAIGLSKINLEIDHYDDYGSTRIECNVTGEMLETDKDYEERLKVEAEQKKMRFNAYQNLKKEFEKE